MRISIWFGIFVTSIFVLFLLTILTNKILNDTHFEIWVMGDGSIKMKVIKPMMFKEKEIRLESL